MEKFAIKCLNITKTIDKEVKESQNDSNSDGITPGREKKYSVNMISAHLLQYLIEPILLHGSRIKKLNARTS